MIATALAMLALALMVVRVALRPGSGAADAGDVGSVMAELRAHLARLEKLRDEGRISPEAADAEERAGRLEAWVRLMYLDTVRERAAGPEMDKAIAETGVTFASADDMADELAAPPFANRTARDPALHLKCVWVMHALGRRIDDVGADDAASLRRRRSRLEDHIARLKGVEERLMKRLMSLPTGPQQRTQAPRVEGLLREVAAMKSQAAERLEALERELRERRGAAGDANGP